MRFRFLAFMSVLAFVGCGSQNDPYSTAIGVLKPTSTMTVSVASASLSVYKPAVGDTPDRYTVQAMATGAPPPPPTIRAAGNGIVVNAPDPLYGLLVRVPDRVNIVVDSKNGNVSVIDVSGNVVVHAHTGKVKIMVSGYAEATTQTGNIDATIGATQWPGTLKFSTDDGDVTVYVPEIAKFHVRLHTDNGTLFTDFNLSGTSVGSNETIDAPVNGGGSNIVIETKHGTARLLRLAPQA